MNTIPRKLYIVNNIQSSCHSIFYKTTYLNLTDYMISAQLQNYIPHLNESKLFLVIINNYNLLFIIFNYILLVLSFLLFFFMLK